MTEIQYQEEIARLRKQLEEKNDKIDDLELSLLTEQEENKKLKKQIEVDNNKLEVLEDYTDHFFCFDDDGNPVS